MVIAPGNVSTGTRQALRARSIELVEQHQAASGAYPAAPGFSAYDGYAWFRDGSFVAEGMSRTDRTASADGWHDWVLGVLRDERDRVEDLVARRSRGEHVTDEEMLPTRYRLDGTRGSEEWWDVQIDGLGTWLWSWSEHARRHGRDLAGDADGVRSAARYLCAFATDPSYDWWEENRDHVHVASLASVVAGLRAALGSGLLDGADAPGHAVDLEELARRRVEEVLTLVGARGTRGAVSPRLVKWVDGDGVDASLVAAVHPLGLVPVTGPVGQGTVAAVRELLCRAGGVHRYAADTFYGGGRWPLLTAFLGWAEVVQGRADLAGRRLAWVASQADDDGLLPEQVGDPLLHPHRHQEWVERWGPVARPLLWSHGMFLVLDDALAGPR